MNQRIKELLKQSGLQPYYDAQEGQIEKFAELIVMECTKILADNSEFRSCVIIGKHFKVEE